VPPGFAETILIAQYLRTHGLLEPITRQVRLVRGRFGRYEVLDLLALLVGYAFSGERTLQAYFERLAPFAARFMASFERGSLPHRATLSRLLSAVDGPCVDALRALCVSSSLTWGWTPETSGGLWERAGRRYLVFDLDGTREAARQRALPQGTPYRLPRAAAMASAPQATKAGDAGKSSGPARPCCTCMPANGWALSAARAPAPIAASWRPLHME
jgi:hypothetical protein